jgi:hypothetical protein
LADVHAAADGWSAKAQFSDALSLLMTLSFPAHQGTEVAIRKNLAGVVGLRIRSLVVVDGDGEEAQRHNLRDHLPRRPSRQRRQLQQAMARYLPKEDELYGQ